MTDEEALRYLDFMGELVESVDDSPTDIDEGYNKGGVVPSMSRVGAFCGQVVMTLEKEKEEMT